MKSEAAALALGPWPLMRNNISRADLDAVIQFLAADDPILTQSRQVAAFEAEWSAWLGVKHSVFVNSGSSANLVTMAALQHRFGPGEVIVPTLTWVSDIAAVLQCGFDPVFVDIDPRTLGMDLDQVLRSITPRTRAIFLTHILGYDAFTDAFLEEVRRRGVPLVEDVCESHGATHGGRRLGTFGLVSNFSFYYAHHLSTIEGGMVCTNDEDVYQAVRMLRAHGMVRESTSSEVKADYVRRHPDLNPDFIFAFPAYNVRSTEINAVIGRSQLPRLDANNVSRTANLHAFLDHLDPGKYRTEFRREGSSNYAFTLVLREPDETLRNRVEAALRSHGIEYRRGTSGGGNQLRQPYLRPRFGDAFKAYPQVDHVHFFGYYIGNYPDLERSRVLGLCDLLNAL
ncbi:MAG: DegT/DnrJ/EryC1/StrS family aminotransferase [Planctomycetaceae bacterium]